MAPRPSHHLKTPHPMVLIVAIICFTGLSIAAEILGNSYGELLKVWAALFIGGSVGVGIRYFTGNT